MFYFFHVFWGSILLWPCLCSSVIEHQASSNPPISMPCINTTCTWMELCHSLSASPCLTLSWADKMYTSHLMHLLSKIWKSTGWLAYLCSSVANWLTSQWAGLQVRVITWSAETIAYPHAQSVCFSCALPLGEYFQMDITLDLVMTAPLLERSLLTHRPTNAVKCHSSSVSPILHKQ